MFQRCPFYWCNGKNSGIVHQSPHAWNLVKWRVNNHFNGKIDQFRYIKIQPNTIDLSTRLWGINPTNSVVISQSLALRSIVLGWILIYRNWSILLHYWKKHPVRGTSSSIILRPHSVVNYSDRIWYLYFVRVVHRVALWTRKPFSNITDLKVKNSWVLTSLGPW